MSAKITISFGKILNLQNGVLSVAWFGTPRTGPPRTKKFPVLIVLPEPSALAVTLILIARGKNLQIFRSMKAKRNVFENIFGKHPAIAKRGTLKWVKTSTMCIRPWISQRSAFSKKTEKHFELFLQHHSTALRTVFLAHH
jgi:hypothetical protein